MRIIGHLDMDAFFASVEELVNPQFRGLPLVVGADPKNGLGRGVVSTANYEARKYGIHSAMPISRAWRLSEKAIEEGKPKTIFLPVNMRLYAEVSQRIMEIIRSKVVLVEQASIDEAYLDLSFGKSYSQAEKLAKKIKQKIFEQEKLTCSVGIGPNKLIAKIAAGMEKPDGLTMVKPMQVQNFLALLSVRELPGVGPKTGAVLNKEGILTIKDLRKVSKKFLEDKFGKWGSEIYQKAMGLDDSSVVEEYETKSVGEQETFEEDTRNPSILHKALNKMAERLLVKLKNNGFNGFRTLVLVIRFEDFQTKTRSHSLKQPTGNVKILKQELLKLLMPFLDSRENPKRKAFRLAGLRLENLS